MAYKSVLDHKVSFTELIANVTPGLMEQYADDPNLISMLVLGK